jgi:hypothetical protein
MKGRVYSYLFTRNIQNPCPVASSILGREGGIGNQCTEGTLGKEDGVHGPNFLVQALFRLFPVLDNCQSNILRLKSYGKPVAASRRTSALKTPTLHRFSSIGIAEGSVPCPQLLQYVVTIRPLECRSLQARKVFTRLERSVGGLEVTNAASNSR